MKKYNSLSEALSDLPKTKEEFIKQAQEDLENSSTSEKQNLEQPEPTDKYEVKFVKNPKK